jgi:hypothetical protein
VDQTSALTQGFEANRPHLRAVAYRILGNVADADDAVQEAWLRLSASDARSNRQSRWLVDHRRLSNLFERPAFAHTRRCAARTIRPSRWTSNRVLGVARGTGRPRRLLRSGPPHRPRAALPRRADLLRPSRHVLRLVRRDCLRRRQVIGRLSATREPGASASSHGR